MDFEHLAQRAICEIRGEKNLSNISQVWNVDQN